MQKVPLVDLNAQYQAYKPAFDAAVANCLKRTSFIGGPDHKAFADEFAAWCGGGHVTLVGNGTDALILALIGVLGRGNGADEIITVSNTFIATVEAILEAGYRPVLVDVDPDTMVMDPDKAAAAISPKTRALLPVHLYGQMAPMDRLAELCRSRGLKLIEDAAQSHGATWQKKQAGALSDAACFSFYPGKNLGAWGDGGAIFTRDKELAARINMRANHGRTEKYTHEFCGVNSRLDGLQAAILRVKLPHLNGWNAARRGVAKWYDELLGNQRGVKLPATARDAEHVYHLYVVEVDNRDAILKELNAAGIGAGVHYPIPLHEQPALADYGYRPDQLPVSSRAAKRILSLPIFPEMTRDQAEYVASTLLKLIRKT